MSMVGTVIRLTHELTRRTAHAIVHPVETASGVADLAGSAASAAVSVVTAVKEADREPVARSTPAEPDETPATAGPPEPEPREALLFPPEPAPTPEPTFTEPKASDIDDWQDELDDLDDLDEADEGLAVPEPDDDTPLLDPSVAKAVRHESETMRRAADRDPESAADEVNGH